MSSSRSHQPSVTYACSEVGVFAWRRLVPDGVRSGTPSRVASDVPHRDLVIEGHLLVTLNRCFYLAVGDPAWVVGIGPRDKLGQGPAHVLVEAFTAPPVRVGERLRVRLPGVGCRGGGEAAAGGFALHPDYVAVEQLQRLLMLQAPDALPAWDADFRRVEQALARVMATVSHQDAAAEQARAGAALAGAALAVAGRGPGLTPVGDDFLAGLMAASVRLGPSAGRLRALWRDVLPQLMARTSTVSRVLLLPAVDGLLPEAAEGVLTAVQQPGVRPTAALGRLLAVGSSSGSGLAWGLVRGLRGARSGTYSSSGSGRRMTPAAASASISASL